MFEISDPSEFIKYLMAMLIPFLPALFGAVEFVKSKKNLSGPVVEYISIGIFVFYGALVLLAYYFPGWGVQVLSAAVFLLMCALAPSGFYKFIAARTSKNE